MTAAPGTIQVLGRASGKENWALNGESLGEVRPAEWGLGGVLQHGGKIAEPWSFPRLQPVFRGTAPLHSWKSAGFGQGPHPAGLRYKLIGLHQGKVAYQKAGKFKCLGLCRIKSGPYQILFRPRYSLIQLFSDAGHPITSDMTFFVGS